jgi:hypothetical protein
MKMLVTITLIICLVLTISSCGNDNEITPHNSEIKNENEQEKEEENEQNETDENTDEQRENEPRDFINGFPLYIEFEEDFAEHPGAGYYFNRTGMWGRNIAIAYSGGLYKIELYRVSFYDSENGENHLLGERIFNVKRGYVESSFVVYCTASVNKWFASYAVVLTDRHGETHTYFLKTDENDEELIVKKVEASRQRRGDQSFIDIIGKETATIRFFSYDSEKDPAINNPGNRDYYKYESEIINVNNFTEEFIHFMRLHTGIVVDDIWFEGFTVCVDLEEYDGERIGNGSLGTAISISMILMTVSTIPNAERIEILIDGKRWLWGGKFDFTQPFEVRN